MQDTLEYPYRPSARAMLLGMAFFGACGAMMARAAINNDRGLIINGLITFELDGATTFYWCVAAVCMLFVAAAALGVVSGRSTPKVVRLTPIEISAPRYMFSRQPTTVRLSDIRDAGVQEIHRQRLLTINHPGGSLTIAQSMLPSPDAFEQLQRALFGRLESMRANAGGLRHANFPAPK